MSPQAVLVAEGGGQQADEEVVGLGVEPAHDAPVDDPHPPVAEQSMLPACTSPWKAPHRTVVRKKARTTCSTSGRRVDAEVRRPGQVVDGHAVEELHGQHVGARELGEGLGHHHQRQVDLVEQVPEGGHGPGLVAEVELLADLLPGSPRKLEQGAGRLVAGLAGHQLEQRLEQVEVGGH